MSGNTTRLATELASDPPRALIPALLILGFVAGVTLGHIVGHFAGSLRKPAVLALVTLLLGAALTGAHRHATAPMMADMVLAMGALNTTMRKGETPVALTYLTGALVRIGQGIGGLVTGERQPGLPGLIAFALLWLALALGASIGAALFLALGPDCLALAVGWSGLLTFAGWRVAARG